MTKKSKVEIEDIPTAADMARGDEVLKKMLQTKPKVHKDMVGKIKLGGSELKGGKKR